MQGVGNAYQHFSSPLTPSKVLLFFQKKDLSEGVAALFLQLMDWKEKFKHPDDLPVTQGLSGLAQRAPNPEQHWQRFISEHRV